MPSPPGEAVPNGSVTERLAEWIVNADYDELRQPQARVVLRLENGERYEETFDRSHGSPSDSRTDAEVIGKFHECSEGTVPQSRRDRIIGLCKRFETLADIRELTDTIGAVTV